MLTLVTLIHVIFCLLLIALVLLQDPKSSGTGGVFGGGGANSVLGSTGAVTFLTRLTRYSAIVFGVTCLVLSLLSKPNSGSVLDSLPATSQGTPTTVPATEPATAPATEGSAAQPLPSNPAALKDPKQAGTEAAPAQGSNPVQAEKIRENAPATK